MNDNHSVTQFVGTTNRNNSLADAKIDLHGREISVRGQFPVVGAGEIIVPVIFPVTFTELPLLSFGAAMDVNQKVVAGNLPTVSVVVQKYTIIGGAFSTKYSGASLIVVTSGDPSQKIWIHWHFVGQALINPISGVSTTEDTL